MLIYYIIIISVLAIIIQFNPLVLIPYVTLCNYTNCTYKCILSRLFYSYYDVQI